MHAVSECIGHSPDDAVDTEQTQSGPSRMAGCFMQTFLSQIEDLSYGLATLSLKGLDYGAGRSQPALSGQHNVHATDHIPHRPAPEKRHGDDAPKHHFQGQAPLAQGGDTGLFQGLLYHRRIKKRVQIFEGIGSRDEVADQFKCRAKRIKNQMSIQASVFIFLRPKVKQ